MPATHEHNAWLLRHEWENVATNDATCSCRTPTTNDSGTYECQINTKPTITQLINLEVLGKLKGGHGWEWEIQGWEGKGKDEKVRENDGKWRC